MSCSDKCNEQLEIALGVIEIKNKLNGSLLSLKQLRLPKITSTTATINVSQNQRTTNSRWKSPASINLDRGASLGNYRISTLNNFRRMVDLMMRKLWQPDANTPQTCPIC